MKILVQRVAKAEVKVDGEVIGQIGEGLLLYVGFTHGDCEAQVKFGSEKCLNLRIFPDEEMKMNRSLIDVSGEMLIISQFTLYGDCSKGRRPSFVQSMEPRKAEDLYEKFINQIIGSLGNDRVSSGQFGAQMMIESINIGPTNFIIENTQLEAKC